MILGDQILDSGDYLEALRHYEAAIDPMNPDALALYRSGAALDGIGRVDGALQKYSEAIRVDPKLALAYYGRGLLLTTRKRAYVRAVADFDRVLTLEPNNIAALIQRGDAYSQLGDVGHALADLNRAIQLDPEYAKAFVVRGLIQYRRGDKRLALADFQRALRVDPNNTDALRNRGALYAGTGQPDLAIRDFDAVIALSPTDPTAFFNRGYALFAKRQYTLAAIDYGTAIFYDSQFGAAYLNRCLTLTILGRDLVEALADCDQALKLMPTAVAAREARGFIYLKLGDPAIAATEYEAALRIDPNRPLALYGVGLAKIRLGRKADGEADQAAALVLSPTVASEFSVYGVD
jgi:tetratricopeptide (TPR) repeat protein